jgi:light-regulated signal transduction histidine kinase (bacteriophytochrome)
MTTTGSSELDEVDLSNCDREPIHLLGKVQSFGFLLAVTPEWIVSHASENAGAFLGAGAESMLGRPARDFIPSAGIHQIRNRLQFIRPHKGVEVAYGLELIGTEQRFDVSVHHIDSNIIMEFEPASSLDGAANDTANVRIAVDRMADLPDLQAVYSHTVRFIRSITGFDRVMFYKFAPDGSGQVVAEARNSAMTPFLNLRYPASDIPKQARALYLENPIRLIADVADDGVPVLQSRSGEPDLPIDLSGSRLRAVSPIHIEYLRNMGVGASMSISVIVSGELWGLIACHHNAAHVPTMRDRNCALLFGQMLSLVLQSRLADVEKANDKRVADLTAGISRSLSSHSGTPAVLKSSAQSFAGILEADGFAVVQEDNIVSDGKTPGTRGIRDLCGYLNNRAGNEVFASSQLSAVIDGWDGGDGATAGVLSIPISRSPRDYILFFREELVRQVNWAGDPEKPVTYGPNGARLTPRKSFEAWQTTVRDQSADWTPADLRAASQLRIMLLEVVLRLTDAAGRQRKADNEKQELLIAELNHRVRNILGLVRGLITQTNSGSGSTADFVSKLDSRVQSLARAHDQITRQNWSPASFRQLIDTEAESYLLGKKDRVVVSGPPVMLTPQAFSSLALVMHEMLTNSAKYGALSDQRGRVDVALALGPGGELRVSWSETGGPPVKSPQRRGFGSTIIERTVPFELKGEAHIDYPAEGVKALFRIPGSYVLPGEEETIDIAEANTAMTREKSDAPRSVLIVEDNLIIALDAEDIFRTLGTEEVSVVAGLEAAFAEIERRAEPFHFALLDINLGAETSFPLALHLYAAGVPFAFASGYGESADIPEELRNVTSISKPYDKDLIAELFILPERS